MKTIEFGGHLNKMAMLGMPWEAFTHVVPASPISLLGWTAEAADQTAWSG